MTNSDLHEKYEMTIGIECHVQLATRSKLFSASNNDARELSPNSALSLIDYGLPGMLPVLNGHAIVLAVKAGLALGSTIAEVSRFDRKHYFYPDLPKGYQTTQMFHPIIIGGLVNVPLEDDRSVSVRIHHAHLEEDAGKLTHFSDYSLVDLNRAGTPLIEIVSEPDMHSAEEAKAYASELHALMTYAGVTNGDLYHGNMRFDVNVSVAPRGAAKLGTRAEIKNLNSFRSVERAAEYEFKRQAVRLEAGEIVVQETRGWDDAKQKTSSQRSKEDAMDYRYMPDADIPPVYISPEEVAQIETTMSILPPMYRAHWKPLGLDSSVVGALLADQRYALLISRLIHSDHIEAARRTAHWLSSSLSSETSQLTINFDGLENRLIELSSLVKDGKLSSTASKQVFLRLITSEQTALEVSTELNLLQMTDMVDIEKIVLSVLAEPSNQKAVSDIKSGSLKVIGFLVGQVMKQSAGKANPAVVNQMIQQKLE